MPIEPTEAGRMHDLTELHALVKRGLQTLLDVTAVADFKLPISIGIFDDDGAGDLLREFFVEGNRSLRLGRSADIGKAYILPLVAVAMDRNERVALLRLDADVIEPAEFVN